MKELLKKYYGIEIDNYRKYNNGIIFFINGDYYYLCQCVFTLEEVLKSYDLSLQLKNKNILLHDFVYNNDNNLISENFVLFKMNVLVDVIDYNDLRKVNVFFDYDLKDDFYLLWTNKIDALEKNIINNSDDITIAYSFDYFIGLAELLLIFYKDNVLSSNSNYIVHRCFYNLSTIDFYNPLNIIIGNKYKDIAIYIRLSNDWKLLYNVLDNINEFDRVELFVRLTFPFEYFHLLYDSIDGMNFDKISLLIGDLDKYENYLIKISELFGYDIFDFIKKYN